MTIEQALDHPWLTEQDADELRISSKGSDSDRSSQEDMNNRVGEVDLKNDDVFFRGPAGE